MFWAYYQVVSRSGDAGIELVRLWDQPRLFWAYYQVVSRSGHYYSAGGFSVIEWSLPKEKDFWGAIEKRV
jgi:hypothetical protein